MVLEILEKNYRAKQFHIRSCQKTISMQFYLLRMNRTRIIIHFLKILLLRLMLKPSDPDHSDLNFKIFDLENLEYFIHLHRFLSFCISSAFPRMKNLHFADIVSEVKLYTYKVNSKFLRNIKDF